MNRIEQVALGVAAVGVLCSFVNPGYVAGLAGLVVVLSLGYRKVLKK